MNEIMQAYATFDEQKRIVGFERLTNNPITDTDSYKPSHPFLFAPEMDSSYYYFASRGGRYRYTCFNGAQALVLGMTDLVTMDHVREAAEIFEEHGEPFYREGWERIVTHYGGRIPLRIRAVPEGLVVPTGNVLLDVEPSTPDPMIRWLPGWFETKLVRLWYPTTVATRGAYLREKILEALVRSSDDPMAEIDYKLHCFGSRGSSSMETARIGGCAHLINFRGSDTVEALRHARHYYGAKMAGVSIPAPEHSVITSFVPAGSPADAEPGAHFEEAFFEHLVRQFLYGGATGKKYPIVAAVSDSYDLYNAIENYWCGERLLPLVRNSGGRVVIRPDSGTPAEVDVKALTILERKLGMRKNTKEFKVLPTYYRLIQGDGVNDESVPEILHEVMAHGYSADNINFGMGGGGLQDMTRDTLKFAEKMAAMLRLGRWSPVSKKPKTDPGKNSMGGRFALVHEGGAYATVPQPRKDDYLTPIFDMGRVLKTYTWEEVRANARKNMA
jgi:nicotinamide phosphoribosyltransferase